MKKILTFVVAFAMGVGVANAAVRDGNSASRGGGTTTSTQQKRTTTTTKPDRSVAPRTTVLGADTVRAASNQRTTTARTAQKNITARATATTTETRTGTQYETCKNAYFTCMDQFCALKNDDYRRCSCSNRIDSLMNARDSLVKTGEQITVFNENLDTVGMTAAQAKALHTASDGENALTSDTSASKALLQAILNSIRGGDTTVGGKYSDLNSINLSFDTSIAFGTGDTGQIIASYNGQNLYSAVYPQCRNAVRDDCNDASLQRAVTAYLMAIEQDCNTVQTAIEQKQKELKYAVRESSALLDLARIENRQKHNSDNFTTCISNVESAILSEEVCGANYHKCLDNGEFIDISTGAPITGVVEFNKLGELLSFDTGTDTANQRLSKMSRNKSFVMGFEKRTKKFAEPALDKCVEIADTVWEEYLDKAMLAIYYAQQSKVSEIKQGCFDFISQCYTSTDKSITAAMSKLLGDNTVILQPDKITLSSKLCTDYVDSCNNMFSGDIIKEYVNLRQEEDLLSACRAVVKQCFDKYGGTGYENFYYPYSGLFVTGKALDWFTLYDESNTILSPCAQQLTEIDSCKNRLVEAFGGLDKFQVNCENKDGDTGNCQTGSGNSAITQYGAQYENGGNNYVANRKLRSVGVATEIYNQIIDSLSTQCRNVNGRFLEQQFLQDSARYNATNYCQWHTIATSEQEDDKYEALHQAYGITSNENMCPRDYSLSVDTKSWGACSCWENGGRRSKNGRAATCMAVLPAEKHVTGYNTSCSSDTCIGSSDAPCEYNAYMSDDAISKAASDTTYWCKRNAIDADGRVCPSAFNGIDSDGYCYDDNNDNPGSYFNTLVPSGSQN